MSEAFDCVALIPARAGSKRVKDKNIRLLGGKPLLAWTIQAADESGLFKDIAVSSDSDEILKIAGDCGATAIKRPEEYATDTSPDIEWLRHALAAPWLLNIAAFALLRPTSPFRTADTIRRAYAEFSEAGRAIDSLRAVERVKQHPGKMWRVLRQRGTRPYRLVPLLPQPEYPWHSSQMAVLPEVWVQNASMEIAWIDTIERYGNQAGEVVVPFFTGGHEGFDINDEYDWKAAEMIARLEVKPRPRKLIDIYV